MSDNQVLDNKQVYAKVYNFYKQVQHGKMNIGTAIHKIQATLALAGLKYDGNIDAQYALDNWDSMVNIHPKIHFIHKLKHDLPTLYNDEYNFEIKELGMYKEEVIDSVEYAVDHSKQELKRLRKLPNVLLQYNSYTGHIEIAQASGLSTLLYNLKNINNLRLEFEPVIENN